MNNYYSIEFGSWIISEYSRLRCKNYSGIENYVIFLDGYKCEYHMTNGIIYTVEYDHEDKSISISTVGGIKVRYTNLKYIFKS